MAEFKRDQFKPTSTKDLKKLKTEEDSIIGSSGSSEFLEIKDGSNKIRLAPKFPGEKEFYLMVRRTWLPHEKEGGETSNIPVLDSIIHGGTKKDIIKEYVEFCKARLDPNKKREKDKLALITDWKKGLIPQTVWRAYGWKLVKDEEPKFGIFEFKRSVRDEINSISIIEDEDEAIEIDPFTDLEEGCPIIVKYDSKAKKSSDYYKVTLSKHAYPVDDDMFEEFSKQKPLSQLYRGCYTIEDYKKAVEGLRIFDIDNEIDLIDEPEFKAIMAEVKAQYTQDDDEKSSKKKRQDDDEDEDEKPKKSKKVVDDEDENEDYKPSKKSKKVEDEDEDEDERPSKKRSNKDDDDEEDEEKPKPKKRVVEEDDDDDDEDEKPKKSKKADDDDDEDETPKKKKSSEEDEKPAGKKLTVEEIRAKIAARKKAKGEDED